MAYIYLLESLDKNHRYLGSTPNTDERLDEHNRGVTKATRYKGPWKIIKIWKCNSLQQARQIEYKLKRMKRKLTIDYVSYLNSL